MKTYILSYKRPVAYLRFTIDAYVTLDEAEYVFEAKNDEDAIKQSDLWLSVIRLELDGTQYRAQGCSLTQVTKRTVKNYKEIQVA